MFVKRGSLVMCDGKEIEIGRTMAVSSETGVSSIVYGAYGRLILIKTDLLDKGWVVDKSRLEMMEKGKEPIFEDIRNYLNSSTDMFWWVHSGSCNLRQEHFWDLL